MTEGSDRGGSPSDGLPGLVEVLRRVPDKYRSFSQSRQEAIRIYRLPEQLLDDLVDLGMPCAGPANRLTFDRDDLANVTLRLGLDTPQRRSLVHAARAIERSGKEPQSFIIDVMGRCPSPDHTGHCDFRVDASLSAAPCVENVEPIAPNHARLALRLPGGEPSHLPMSPEVESLLGSVEDIEFHKLPWGLSNDIGFLREARLADCRLAAVFLADWGDRIGLPVRLVFGVLVSPPLSTEHWWIEVRVEGEWRSADPFFLTALARWGVVDGETWPATRTPPPIYWAMGNERRPFISHAGSRTNTSLMTRMTQPRGLSALSGPGPLAEAGSGTVRATARQIIPDWKTADSP